MIEIVNADCLEWLKQQTTPFIDLTVTSPPYNVGKDYDEFNDSQTEEEYMHFISEVIQELYRLTYTGGRLCLNIPFIGNSWFKAKSDKMLFYPLPYMQLAEAAGWTPRDFFVWVKTTQPENPNVFCGNATSWGSWLSPSCPYARCFAEVILVFHKEDKTLRCKGEADLTKDRFLELTKNVWYFPAQHQGKNPVHPAAFPVELPRRCIQLYTWKGMMVFDPFAGSGTTAAAAQELGRDCICIEISKRYCKVARERLACGNIFEGI